MVVRVDITTVTSSSFHVSWDEYTEFMVPGAGETLRGASTSAW
jgi:hypothetical protein